MLRFDETSPDDPDVRALLDRYFAERIATRPASYGPYVAVHPDPAQFTPPHGIFVVARDASGTPVACGGLRRIAPDAPWRHADFGGEDWMELKHVFTAPEARGHGTASTLLGRLDDLAALMRADRLVVDSSTSLGPALRLYERRGFAPMHAYNDNPNADLWLGKVPGANPGAV